MASRRSGEYHILSTNVIDSRSTGSWPLSAQAWDARKSIAPRSLVSTSRKLARPSQAAKLHSLSGYKAIFCKDEPTQSRDDLLTNTRFGVSRVYSQQCTFVLSDAEHVRTQVRNAMNALRAQVTTEKSHVARREHITTHDDSQLALDPEGDFLPGLPRLALLLGQGGFMVDSQTFSLDAVMSQPSLTLENEPPTEQLIIPVDDSPAHLDLYSTSLPPASSVSGSRRAGSVRLGSHLFDFDPLGGGMLDDVGLNIDPDGNIFEGPMDMHDLGTLPQARKPSATARETIEGPSDHPMQPQDQRDLDLLENAQPFSPRRQSEQDATVQNDAAEIVATEEPPVAEAAAPNRSQRRPRAIPLDTRMEMSNSDFSAMDTNYAENMHHASTARFYRGGMAQAQRNAQVWVLGSLMSREHMAPELLMFTGANVLATLKRPSQQASPSSSKRSSEDDHDERRVRPRIEGSEIGRAYQDELTLGLEEALLHDDPTLELGREPGTPLADRRSSLTINMPWNIRSSTRGSSAPRYLLSGAGASSAAGGPLSLGIRGSSVAASPLDGLPRPIDLTLELDRLDNGMDDAAMHGFAEDDATRFLGADIPSWLNHSQDPDSGNFFEFVLAALEEKRIAASPGGTQETQTRTVEFEELLSPDAHDKTVAAHGLMHVLSLCGKDVLRVQQGQEEPFMPIVLSVF
ncbi:hypothetical protein ANO11243_076400 [Dothideomycetidae sp. 11243]|nr:hypothetical protein ANO11243_076400 [fungal sp. No.11243]